MRINSIQCDRCKHIGRLEGQHQEGWRHVQVFDVTNDMPKDAGSYDLCFSCIKVWENFLNTKEG